MIILHIVISYITCDIIYATYTSTYIYNYTYLYYY